MRLAQILDRLEKFHGKPKHAQPADPYEMILYRNCGYPQSDDRCEKGFSALRKTVGLWPADILAATDAELAAALRGSGMMPELRTRRLKEIAERVEKKYGGDLRATLKRPLPEARKALKEFPTIGDPTIDKILLFSKTAPIAAIPGNCIRVPLRLGFGEEKKSYAASYRSAQERLAAELPPEFPALQRAYLLLKIHGESLCKNTRPLCEECPVSSACLYFQRTRTKN
jgi:endonuclease III